MAYRNIEVNGNSYKYTVGKTHLHIKGDGIKSINRAIDEVGIYHEATDTHAITPAIVKSLIEKETN